MTRDDRKWAGWKAYASTFAMLLAALAIGLALQYARIEPSNVSLIFLIAVFMSAVLYGLYPALFACLASVLAYNYFFFPPLYTLRIADPGNVLALFFFGLVAVVASNLAVRVRAQALAARERAAMTESLYLFSRKLAEVFTLDDLLWAIAFQIARMLKVRVIVLLPEAGRLVLRGGYPPDDVSDVEDMVAANWTWKHGASAGRGTAHAASARRLFLPLRTGRGIVGVVGLDNDDAGALIGPEQQALFDSLADQAALALERMRLSEDFERARLAAETERLRSAMLTSLSHDLRTPLASILGSASSLRQHRAVLDEAARRELVDTIWEEAERLNRFIANLLDMTRLEAGSLDPKLDFVDLGDVVGSALHRADRILEGHAIETDLPADLPLVKLDPVLFEQALFNLLDNAAKYAPPGTRIALRAREDGAALHLSIEDEGKGIAPADLERIFDKFYRARSTDRQRAGTGLGLAISRGFIAAMNGTLVAENRGDGGGARFVITLPIPADRQAERAA